MKLLLVIVHFDRQLCYITGQGLHFRGAHACQLDNPPPEVQVKGIKNSFNRLPYCSSTGWATSAADTSHVYKRTVSD